MSLFRGVQPSTRYPGPGWTEADIANLCDSGAFPAFECVSYNQTHDAILAMYAPFSFINSRFQGQTKTNNNLPYFTCDRLLTPRLYSRNSQDFFFKFGPGIGNFQRLETMCVLQTKQPFFGLCAGFTDSSRFVFRELRGMVLQGTISPELGQITTLRVLALLDPELVDRNVADYFHGPIPSELGNLVNLESLCVDNLSIFFTFFSSIPFIADQSSTAQNRTIRGYYCNGTIPSSFASLTKLLTLHLEGNFLTSPLPDLSTLTNLKYLNLASNKFYQDLPAWISTLPSLENMCAPHFAEPAAPDIPLM